MLIKHPDVVRGSVKYVSWIPCSILGYKISIVCDVEKLLFILNGKRLNCSSRFLPDDLLSVIVHVLIIRSPVLNQSEFLCLAFQNIM